MSAKRKEGPRLSRTTAVATSHERQKANPDLDDLNDPEEVWKDAETTPMPDEEDELARGGQGRVADAGDVGGGQGSPYGTPAQADAVAKQTRRGRRPGAPQKSRKR